MVDISYALTIPGWMSELELAWLAEQASQHQRIAEIGSYQGRSTRAMADNTEGTIWAIDIWGPGKWTEDIDWMTDQQANQYEQFIANLNPHTETKRVRPLRCTSLLAAKVYRNFDMIFIDGAHDYESVRADIAAWAPLATDLLCGHDYDHPGVLRAVKELIPDHEVIEGTTIWRRL